MNNLDRKAKLEKAMAFDGTRAKILADKCEAEDFLNVPSFLIGVSEESFRLASLHAALIEAVEALEEFADFDNQYEPKMVCWPASEYMKKSRIALAKIDEALEGMGG